MKLIKDDVIKPEKPRKKMLKVKPFPFPVFKIQPELCQPKARSKHKPLPHQVLRVK